jgi:hypothetical protein
MPSEAHIKPLIINLCLYKIGRYWKEMNVTRTTDSGTHKEYTNQHTETETWEHVDNTAVHYAKQSKVIDIV